MGGAPGYSNPVPGYPQTMQAPPPPQPTPPPPAPPPQESSSTNTTLLSETRQQTTEVRLEIQKISSKVEEISGKIDKLRDEGTSSGSGSMISRGATPTMETSVLLHNIQRIIQVCVHTCTCVVTMIIFACMGIGK